MNAQDGDVGRNVLVLQNVRQAVFDVLFRDRGHGGGLRQRGGCKAARRGPCRHSTATVRSATTVRAKVIEPDRDGLESSRKMAPISVPFAHVVGHHEEDGGQGGERNVAGERRERPARSSAA